MASSSMQHGNELGGMSEAAFNSMGRESLRVAIAKQAFPLLPLAEALSRVILDADVTNARRRLQEQNGAFKVSFTIVASSEAERANVDAHLQEGDRGDGIDGGECWSAGGKWVAGG